MIFLIKKEGKSCIMKKMRYICEQIKKHIHAERIRTYRIAPSSPQQDTVSLFGCFLKRTFNKAHGALL